MPLKTCTVNANKGRNYALYNIEIDLGSESSIHDVLKTPLWVNGLSEMGSKEIKASKDAVLFPDDLDIVDIVGERFHADNWFKYMSDRLKEKRSSPIVSR